MSDHPLTASLPPFRRPPGSRLAPVALALAFVSVLLGGYLADRALVAADRNARALTALQTMLRTDPAAAARAPDADSLARLTPPTAGLTERRLAFWGLGIVALSAVAIGLAYERRLSRRIAERSAELERLSGELIQVNRAKSEFLANVSHELRTPLNAIVGFVELLEEGVYGPLASRQVGPVQRIAASASHLRQLVDQLLDLAKIAAGRLEVHREPIQLRPFVLDVATELEPLVQAKGLALSLGVPASLPRLSTDPSHLRQILVNLLANAIKFTASGRITIRAGLAARPPAPDRAGRESVRRLALPFLRAAARRRAAAEAATDELEPARWVAVQVADTGIGIAPDAQARIFDEFEQIGPRTGDAAERGTGLGLAISRRLARLIGGDLTVESAVGRGTTFTLWLPVEPAGRAPGAVSRA